MRIYSFVFTTFVFLFISIVSISVSGQTLEDRVESLEKTLALESMIDKKIESAKDSLQQNIIISVIAVLAFILGGLISLFHSAKNYVDKRLKNELATILDTKKEFIEKWIEDNKTEEKLLKQTRVLVLSYGQDFKSQAPPEVSRALGRFNTRNAIFETYSEDKDHNIGDKDLLFINNANGKFPMEMANRYLSETASLDNKTAYFYFGGLHLDRSSLNAHPYAGTANIAANVYVHLLNLLKMRTQSEA